MKKNFLPMTNLLDRERVSVVSFNSLQRLEIMQKIKGTPEKRHVNIDLTIRRKFLWHDHVNYNCPWCESEKIWLDVSYDINFLDVPARWCYGCGRRMCIGGIPRFKDIEPIPPPRKKPRERVDEKTGRTYTWKSLSWENPPLIEMLAGGFLLVWLIDFIIFYINWIA